MVKFRVQNLPKGMFKRPRSSAACGFELWFTEADASRSDRVVIYFRGTFDAFCLSILKVDDPSPTRPRR